MLLPWGGEYNGEFDPRLINYASPLLESSSCALQAQITKAITHSIVSPKISCHETQNSRNLQSFV